MGEGRRRAYLFGVEIGYARNFNTREEMLVSVCRNGSIETLFAIFTMGTNGGNTQEEGLLGVDGVVKEFQRSIAYDVGGVLALDGAVGLVVEGHEGVEVAVCSGVEEDCV